MRHGDGRLLLKEATCAAQGGDGDRLWCVVCREAGAPVEQRRRHEELVQRSDRLDRLGVVAGGVAHDVNNLLTGILGGVSLARRRMEAGEAEAAARLLDQAERAGQRSAALMRQLLGVARGGGPARHATGRLAELVGDAAELAARGSPVRCAVDADPALWPVEVDTGEIAQVVQNLVINAIQASVPGGCVQVSLRNRADAAASGRRVQLQVSDRGCGIAAADLARVFEPWFTTKPEGTGLGLAISRAVVERHGGTIAVESEPGVGTVFTVLLPAVEVAAPAAPAAPAAAPPGGGHALVMDDDPTVRGIAVAMLVSLGWSVDAVADGGSAVAAVRGAVAAGRPFDLALLDLTVPGALGGIEIAPAIRLADPSLAIVLSSGHAPEIAEAQAQAAGLDAALPKPYSVAQFAAAVAAALAARRAAV